METKSETLREILGTGKRYSVPKFQRDYSWGEDEWEDLWIDITNILELPLKQQQQHYMGFLVFQKKEKTASEFTIIDGQQRLVTLSIIILAAIKKLLESESEESEKQAKGIIDSYITAKDSDYVLDINKLTLNRNNQIFYEKIVKKTIRKEALNKKLLSGEQKTVKLMYKALGFFYTKINEQSKYEITEVINCIADNFLFTVLHSSDEFNAYLIFEILNARGVKLSAGDLLKNYIFSKIDEKNLTPSSTLDELDAKWEKTGSNIDGKSYSKFILAHWNSKGKKIREKDVFKKIRKEVNNAEKASDYLDELTEDSVLFGALHNSRNEIWAEEDEQGKIREDIGFLKLFNIRQPHSLLMACYKKFNKDFHKILSWVVVLSMRYNVICSKHTGRQDAVYGDICEAINKGCKVSDVKEKLMKLYPENEEFKLNFAKREEKTRENRLAHYILASLEKHLSGGNIKKEDYSLEHILPASPEGTDWDENKDSYEGDIISWANRLGNMALVKPSINKELKRKNFLEKKEILKSISPKLRINKLFEKYDEWNAGNIEARQRKLAEMAVETWKID